MGLFRELTPSEETKFRAWAREHYEPFSPISGVWHPVVQDECARINAENARVVIIDCEALFSGAADGS